MVLRQQNILKKEVITSINPEVDQKSSSSINKINKEISVENKENKENFDNLDFSFHK